MPTYDYACPDCGPFEAIRRIGQRDDPVHCPDCATASPRVVGGAPQLALMADGTRRAIEINERARHEPKSSRDVGHRHGPNCGCGKGGRATVRAPNGAKAFPSKRPWMISH